METILCNVTSDIPSEVFDGARSDIEITSFGISPILNSRS